MMWLLFICFISTKPLLAVGWGKTQSRRTSRRSFSTTTNWTAWVYGQMLLSIFITFNFFFLSFFSSFSSSFPLSSSSFSTFIFTSPHKQLSEEQIATCQQLWGGSISQHLWSGFSLSLSRLLFSDLSRLFLLVRMWWETAAAAAVVGGGWWQRV